MPITATITDDAALRHVIVVPTLAPNAPMSLNRRLMARVVAPGTGTCLFLVERGRTVPPDPCTR